MKMKLRNKKSFCLLLCMMLIVAIVFCTTGCNRTKNQESQTTAESVQSVAGERSILGDGQTEFTFCVVDKDGNETEFEIHTDKKTVGDALEELNLIAGEEGPYGLYVQSVNGITADYDVDQTYWAFYVDDVYAENSVDLTEVTAGAHYTFKVEKQ